MNVVTPQTRKLPFGCQLHDTHACNSCCNMTARGTLFDVARDPSLPVTTLQSIWRLSFRCHFVATACLPSLRGWVLFTLRPPGWLHLLARLPSFWLLVARGAHFTHTPDTRVDEGGLHADAQIFCCKMHSAPSPHSASTKFLAGGCSTDRQTGRGAEVVAAGTCIDCWRRAGCWVGQTHRGGRP